MAKTVAVIGAGPYGLSTAAHLRGRGLHVRIFGSPMASWVENMPAGMLLKSPPAASVLSAPEAGFTLSGYCRDAGEPLLDGDDRVPVETFVRYGRWFAEHAVSAVENVRVLRVDRRSDGYLLELSSGEEATAGAVVVASGTHNFAYVPRPLASWMGEGLVSHSSHHADPAKFAGQDVVVVGAGQSGQEGAALLHEAGARVRLLVRAPHLVFGRAPSPPPHWRPASPLGRSWGLYALARHAAAFRLLPAVARLHLARRAIGPFGAWWLQQRLERAVPVFLGQRVTHVRQDGRSLVLTLRDTNDETRTLATGHVVAATGYRVRVDALDFLAPQLRAGLARVGGFPALDAGFQSSVPGLYFTGIKATATFGPLMRFTCGTRFAAPRLAAAVAARH
ncbi:FAD-dependent oxidoreductase [Streptomyces silvensis]|uniref:Oxidoreductase n=1 Tax=Streptomyces silvensis TaxID=1765722 RepID=A0A0W7X944_9ACTN|nr:FAD-dependent oxidoreductase [Streptomyces silvensis]KUF19328.1 oxidoreductase [Streptomyces silvensis]